MTDSDVTISGRTRLAGVMGWPVAHSLSPRLHNYWLARHGIDGVFVPLPVAPEHFAQALRVLAHLGFRGANVTLPHKEAALRAVDTADAVARRIGAVNTVTVGADGALHGTNTDAAGFAAHLAASVPAFDPKCGHAVILGAGGAARAAAVALLDLGMPEVRLVNRTLARAEALARDLSKSGTGSGALRVVDWAGRRRTLEGAALLVNTTTQGMIGQPPLDLDVAALPALAVVYDIVYNPLETPLLAAARARGNPVVDGIGMLLHQAVPGFAAWFGTTPEVTAELRAHVLAGLKA